MKIFLTLLLSFIVLAETLVPCCLWDNCSPEEMTSDPVEQKKDKSDCSPFAACSTCTPCVVVTTGVSILSATPVPVQHTIVPVVFTLSSYAASLLQPPRLA